MRNKLRRPLAFLLSAVMIVTMSGTPVHAVADRGQPETGLCEHHAAHTDDCGYTEETPGTPCGHEHTEDCYIEVTECVHEHTPECYPEETEDSVSGNEATPANAEEREPENCPHICDKESGCITEKLDCRHEHDSECGYTESTPGTPCTYVCEICNPQDSGEADEEPETGIIKQEQCSCLTLCTEGQINPDCPVCGAEDAGLSDCKGKAEKEDTKQPEDTGICKHHQEHNDACGYQPESEDSEGSPCTYECRICPIEDLIATLPDKVTEDNAEDVRGQLDEILALFSVLTEDEQEQIDLSRCYELQGALDGTNDPDPAEGHAAQQEGDEASVTIDTETLYYATLEEAFAAANGKTATITMLENAECVKNDSAGSPLNITSGNVTLNMNGKTLSGIGYGSYGIVNINGGSLSVQGNGLIEVRTYGISSRGGTLAVTETSFNLTGRNSSVANSGVLNKGGTVIINSGTFSGASSVGQIHHDSGNTTINHAEMTGTTADNPVGVCYFEKGTLTINGGTFSNITVDESKGDLVKVKSVAELLGKGCAFKHQNGTWVTDKEMAGKTLDNVTVQKIPLTVNPQGDTSWYYNSSPHTLAMNAAPVDSGVISYVWKNGTDTLDCTTDNYEIPADTPAGSYTYTCEATCDGYTLSHKFLFEIKQSGTQFTGDGEVKTYKGDTLTKDFTASDTITVKATPTATGQAPANSAMFTTSLAAPAADQMAVFVGDTQVSDPADKGADGSYTMTVSAADVLTLGGVEPNQTITLTAKFVGNTSMANGAGTVDINITAAAKVEKGGVTTYYTEFAEAWKKAQEGAAENPATVTLLADVTLTETLTVTSGQNITLTSAKNSDGNDFTMNYAPEKSTSMSSAIEANGGTFELKGGTINVDDESSHGVYVSGGTFKLTGGAIRVPGDRMHGVYVYGGTATISGGAITVNGHSGSGVKVSSGTAIISGGTITANGSVGNGVMVQSGSTAAISGGAITANGSVGNGVNVTSSGTATITGGTITADNRGVDVSSGTATISGGTITADSRGVYVFKGTATISGGTITADSRGVSVSSGTTTITGGTIKSTGSAIYTDSGTLLEMLGQTGGSPCAYWQGSEPVALTEGQNELPAGTYTVKPCDHSTVTATDNGNGTHSTPECPACGLAGVENQVHDWTETTPCTVCGAVAVAKVVNGSTTTYVGALTDAFTKGNSGATVTLLSEVDLGSNYIRITGSSTFTLDLNGQTVKAATYNAFLILGGSLTIQDSGTGGKIEGSSTTITVTGGTLSIQSGTVSGYYGMEISDGTVNISGGVISGKEVGLWVRNSGKAVLSGGTLIGKKAVSINANASVTLKDMLATGCAYHQNDIPVTKAKGWVDGNIGEVPLDAKPAWLTGTVTVKPCDHSTVTAVDNGNGTHSIPECPACGLAGVENQAHDWTETTPCTVCGAVAVAKVVNGSTTTYVGALADAFTKGNSGATVTLLSEVDLGSNHIRIIANNTFTLDLNGQTVKAAAYNAFLILGGSFTIQDSGTGGKIEGSSTAIEVTGGTLSIQSGTVSGFYGVEISGGTVNISGGVISGEETGLWVSKFGKAVLSGGTLIGGDAVFITANASVTLKNLLAEGYAYHRNNLPVTKAEGWVDSNTWGEVSLDTKAALTGTVTVKKCNHTGEGVYEYTPNEGAETHDMTCLACGYAGATESCAYSDDYGHDETNHWQTCTLCGGKKTEAHTYGSWTPEYNENAITIRRSCENCGYTKTDGTFTAPVHGQTMQYGKPITLTCSSTLPGATFSWSLNGSTAEGTGASFTLPETLAVGSYSYDVTVKWSGSESNICTKMVTFEVTPAPLTATGATAEGRTYDGTNSVEITGVTLAGILNGDDVSVATTGLTGTLNGSNAGTYTNLTLPAMTLTGADAENYTVTRPAGAVPTSVTISKATLTATGATVASKTYDGNTAASVSSVTFTGLVPGEALAIGTDYTATGTFADANAGANKRATIVVELKSSAKANNYTLPKDSSVNATGTITKASSSITTAPSATGITYGQALSASTLTGGTGSVPGAFAWTDSTAKPNAGTAQFEVTFTPTDTNYNSTTTNVSVTVAKATPTLTAPTATAIQYGQKLTDSALTGGTATNPNGSAAIAGSWHWASGNTQPTATGTFPVSFAPSDTANYNTPANTDTSVTVNPAAPKITLTVPADQVVGEDVIVTCTVENPHDATFKEGIPENITLTYQIGSGTPQTITNGKFSIPAGTKKDTVITVTASTDAVNGKYTAATKTATVTVTDKIPVEISGISVTGRVYNGQPLNYTGTPVVKKLDGTVVTDALVSYTWSSVTAPVNAGNYSLVIAVDGGKYIGSTTIPVVIEQAEIRVTAPSKTIYVGETAPVFSAADCNITGLVQGENLKTPPTVAYAEAPDTSKTGSVTVTASGAKVPEGGNYKDQIVYENGTLTITSKPLPPAKYTVTVQAGTGGTASASPTSAEKGTKITLNATPDSGYHFKEWQVISGGVKISNNSFTMPAANVTVKAIFEKDGGTPPQPTRYSVTVQAGTGGTASASPTSAEKGTKITLNATPDSGYHFKEWQVISGGVKISNNSFTMPAANVTVKAIFEKDGGTPPQPTRYSVTVQAGTGGTASASPTSAEKGTKITLTATPDSGYHFKEWQVISGGVKISNNSFTMPAANVTVKAVFERNSNGGGNSGGSGGGSSSGDNGSSGGGSTIVARPDKTKPDTPTTSQTKPAAPDKNGNVAVDNGAVQSAINTAKNDAKKNGNTANGVAVVIPVSPQKGQTSFSVTIKAQTLDTLVREKVKRLEINIEGVIVEGMDADLLKWLDTASANGDIILRVKQISQASLSKEAKAAIGTRPVYDLSLVYLAGGKETPITDFDGHTIAVRLPYAPAKDEKTGNLYAVYVDGKGKVEWLTRSSYDPDLGTVVFEAGHFSIYGIGYKNPAPDFTDIKNHWAEDNIIFVASRGLLTGTGNNQFSPNIGMTRGMFVTALGRLADIDPNSYKTGKFTDVKADAYYAPYVNWAAEKGIVNGTTSTTFSPDTNITREQMAVIMASYAKKLGYDLPAAHEAVTFADNAQISGWAAKKVKAMQQAGILAGKGGNRFDPKGTATRAEVATVLRRFVEIVIDPQTAQGWMQNHSGSWQYLKNGKPVTGWLQDDKKWYWLNNNGWMFTGGWKQIDGKWYYFYSDGSMAVNTTIDGYTIGPDGARK